MRVLNLTANDAGQEAIKAYLEANASEELAAKINKGTPYTKDGKALINKKTLEGFMDYARGEAQKQAAKGAQYAMVDDDVVFGWAIHYFEEEDIVGDLYTLDGELYKPAPKSVSKPTTPPKPYVPPKPEPPAQRSIFELMAEQNDEKDDLVEDVEEEEIEAPTPVEEVAPTVEIPKTKPVNGLYAQYVDYQDSYPDTIIAMRIGDFYEVLGDDAVDIAKRLDLTLTSRDIGLESRIPLVGFPYHAAENYFNKIATFKTVVAIEGDGEVRGYPMPEEPVVEEQAKPQAPIAIFDDEGFFELLRIIGNVEVK